jgi:hypothetical protein
MEEQNENQSFLDGIKIWAKVGVELGETMKKQQATNDELWRRLQFATPVRSWQVQSGVFPASGNLLLNFGTPDSGTYWNIRSFAIGGQDVNITATGKFGLYVSGYANAAVSPGMGALIDGGGTYGGADTMPYSENYGNDSFRVNDQESVFVIIFGGTPGQVYTANLGALVYNSAAALGNSINQG